MKRKKNKRRRRRPPSQRKKKVVGSPTRFRLLGNLPALSPNRGMLVVGSSKKAGKPRGKRKKRKKGRRKKRDAESKNDVAPQEVVASITAPAPPSTPFTLGANVPRSPSALALPPSASPHRTRVPPAQFLCAISGTVMTSPALVAPFKLKSSQAKAARYELAVLSKFVQTRAVDPHDRAPCSSADILPDPELEREILAWRIRSSTMQNSPSKYSHTNRKLHFAFGGDDDDDDIYSF